MNKEFKRILSLFLSAVMLLSVGFMGEMPEVSAADVQRQYSNVAQGKGVSFSYGSELTADTDYGPAAINAGLSVLTDGINDSPNWWVNNGNPYIALKSAVISGPYTFVVDLGSNYDAKQICLYSYGRPAWGIYPAEAVTYSISSDAGSWTSLETVTLDQARVKTVEDPRYEGSTVDLYEFALDVNATGRYIRAVFDTNATGLVGIGEIEVYGAPAPQLITKGANVTYFGHGTEVGSDANWGDAAVRSGLSVLTDGVGNSPNWWVNNGNPNLGLKASVLPGPYVFNLDIGAPGTVSRISSYFYSRTDWGVDAPDAVTYSVSYDGIIWKEMGTVEKSTATVTTLTDERNPDDQNPSIYTFTLLFDAVDARYVKLSFDTNAIGMIGLQELQAYGVKKTITNLALGRMATAANYTYQVTGGGTGYESTGTTKPDGSRYTVTEVELASAARLTDGTIVNASAVTYPSNWASQTWNSAGTIMSKYLQIYRNDSRIITLDLGAVRNVTGIRMHFGALESTGFYMPTNVTYYLSQDGETYYEAADVWNYQTTADANDANISGTTFRHTWYAASGINYNARYVKVSFPVNVYILADELQVYGTETVSPGAADLTARPVYDPLKNYVGHFADAAQTGGVRNEFMAYSGWYINSEGGEVYNTYKTVKEYMTSIAYIDANGVPQDWLFDDVTVMGHYYTAKGTFNSYKAGYTEGKYYANQSDWNQWLCYAFGKDTNGNDLSYDGNSVINLEALEEAARIAKETLNDPDYKVGVKLVLYPAVEYQENWGTIDGQTIDFTVAGCGSQEKALENRAKAYQWYVDRAVQMWEEANFQHLELTGFYYYEETIHESTDRIAKAATQALTDIIHTHATPATNTKPSFDSRVGGRLYIYQLPFYQSEGYWNWSEYGFDYALMQPNYSFYDMYTLTQLKECAELCTYYGLGMQMEFGGTASTAYHEKFMDYLTYGKEYGYQSAVVSWYMSTWGCYSMAYNNNGTRYLYDEVYAFVKGQTIPACSHESHNTDGRCTNCAELVEHTAENGVCSICGKSLVQAEGQCGENVFWSLDLDGKLTITGSGDMWNFDPYSSPPPWYGYQLLELEVQSGVTSIGGYAFYRAYDLQKAVLPQTVNAIYEYAFFSCEKMTQLTLPDTLTFMGDSAFSYCTALSSVKIPAGLTELPNNAFSSCYSLQSVELPAGLVATGTWAFSQCRTLQSVTLPEGLKTISVNTFQGCRNLNSINIPESVDVIDSSAFHDCEDLTQLDLPDTMSAIGDHAFHNTGLYSLTIPEGITDIPDEMVSFTENLTTVVLPQSLERIGGYSFRYCDSLKTINIPERVTEIGSYAFSYCTTLESLEIPDSVTSIGIHAFDSCHALTSIKLPANLKVISSDLMLSCWALETIALPDCITEIGQNAFRDCISLKSITIPGSLQQFGTTAFGDCPALASVTVEEGVTAIGHEAFQNCTALTQVNLPDTLTVIYDRAFMNCNSLETITIPANVTVLGTRCFKDATSLKQIDFAGDAPAISEYTFEGVVAQAQYSSKNAGWTEDVLQNYAGQITWIDTHVSAIPTISLKYPTLTFEDVILMNVYFAASDLEDVVEMGLVTYNESVTSADVNTANAVIPGYAWSEADGFYYATTNGIAAKDLGDEIYFAVYAKLSDGTYYYTRVVSYSPKTYAYASLATGSETMKPIVVAMLNYGAAAQSYFGYKTDALVNANLTAEQAALVEGYRSDMITAVASPDAAKQGELALNGGFARRYPTVSFEGAFCINYYATPSATPNDGITMYYWSEEDYNANSVLTLENATAAIPMAGAGVGEYHAAVEGIAAKDLSKGVYVCFVYADGTTTYYSGVLAYSIGTYCGIQANGTGTAAALAQATAVYGYYANELFNK